MALHIRALQDQMMNNLKIDFEIVWVKILLKSVPTITFFGLDSKYFDVLSDWSTFDQTPFQDILPEIRQISSTKND